jgi:hypothetical protein
MIMPRIITYSFDIFYVQGLVSCIYFTLLTIKINQLNKTETNRGKEIY